MTTLTIVVPVAWAGATALMVVALTTVTLVAATVPNLTDVTEIPGPLKLVPVMVTVVPPTVAPVVGVKAATVGAFTEGCSCRSMAPKAVVFVAGQPLGVLPAVADPSAGYAVAVTSPAPVAPLARANAPDTLENVQVDHVGALLPMSPPV